MSDWATIIIIAVVLAGIAWAVAKAIIGEYFTAKGRFVDRLVQKQRSAKNGEGS